MFANYHTHTYLCNHATGSMREYVEVAIKNGIKELGFSDHAPYSYRNGYSSYSRMDTSKIEEYVSTLTELREEFKEKIKIYIGYEAEYYPDLFDEFLENINKYGYDYLILAQHCTNNEYDGAHVYFPCKEEILKKYIDQLISGIKTGKFLYVAHPDFINYREDYSIFRTEFLRLFKICLEYDIPLEFNLLGFKEKRHYPCDWFLRIVSETGCKIIIGCDAHNPENIGEEKIYKMAVNELKKYGIKPIEKLDIKKG